MTPADRARRFFPAHFVEDASGCWVWTRGKTKAGYGAVTIAGRLWTAHRAMYELLKGSVPEGLDLDHLCRVRHCCNPDHLEPVTRRENLLRGETSAALNAAKTHCPQGHAYDEVNTRYWDGRRYCIACCNARNARNKAIRAAARKAAA